MENTKMFLFARWVSTCYADAHLDDKMRHVDNSDFDELTSMSVLNRVDGEWWKLRLMYFNDIIYPNYERDGSVETANEFLKNI